MNYTSFDALGNVLTSNQSIAGQAYSFTYTYNLAGSLASETYPSGRVITTGYDTANRPFVTTGTRGGQQTSYNTQTAYWPQGAISNYWYGNNVVPVYTYNSRLQMSNFWTTVGNDPNHYLLYIVPNWGTTNNNGNLRGALEEYGSSVPLGSLTWLGQSYGYDGVNRLTSVSDTGYTRSFGYDAWGNMWIAGYTGIAPLGNPPTTSSGFNTNNQIPTGEASYDAAGSQTVVNNNTLAYDAENRLSSENYRA